MDGKTKRQAAKDARQYSRQMVQQLKKAEKEPPEAQFDSFEKMMGYLDGDDVSE